VQELRAFFNDIDSTWTPSGDEPITLSIIGSTALMLQTDYRRGTKDSDVIRTAALPPAVETALLGIAGKGSRLEKKHRFYIDVVPPGLPFLAQRPRWHRLDGENHPLDHFLIDVLDVVDVVVSKLKRFTPNDRSDIDAMIVRSHVSHDAFVERFRRAVECHFGDEALPRYRSNFHAIERDSFNCDETPIELPDWME